MLRWELKIYGYVAGCLCVFVYGSGRTMESPKDQGKDNLATSDLHFLSFFVRLTCLLNAELDFPFLRGGGVFIKSLEQLALNEV